jgi:hypothetical protein
MRALKDIIARSILFPVRQVIGSIIQEFQVTSLRHLHGHSTAQDVPFQGSVRLIETSRGGASCPYVPEQDEMEAKLELKTQYMEFTQPKWS